MSRRLSIFHFTFCFLLLLLGLPRCARAQWSTSPYEDLLLASFPAGPLGCTDGAGGALIQQWHGNYPIINYDIYFQHLDSAGYKLLGEDGIVIIPGIYGNASEMISDGEGGAFFSLFLAGPDSAIYAYHVDGSGNHLWDPQGMLVTAQVHTGSMDDYMTIIQDGFGGLIVLWQQTSYDQDGYWAQRLNADGQQMWGVSGVHCIDQPASIGQKPMAPDGSGGLITAYGWSFGPGTGQFYAQRVSGAGQLVWGSLGVPLLRPHDYAAVHDVISDDQGGAWITFDTYWYTYVQHVDSSGYTPWQQGICLNPTGDPLITNIYACPDGDAGLFLGLIYDEHPSGSFVNRMDRRGRLLWGRYGKPISTHRAVRDICQDSLDGAVILLLDWVSNEIIWWAQRVNGSGQILWQRGGVPLVLTPCGLNDQNYFSFFSAGQGNTILVFLRDDYGYAKRLTADGQVGLLER